MLSVDGSECIFNVSSYTLDLSSFKGQNRSYKIGNYSYNYTPCQDGLKCKREASNSNMNSKYINRFEADDKTPCMADKINGKDDKCEVYFAVWDGNLAAIYDESNKEFILHYSNGGKLKEICDDKSYNLTISRKCDKDVTDFTMTNVEISDSNKCAIKFDISSQAACVSGSSGGGNSGSNNGSNNGTVLGLSIGWICIIGFGLVIILYCILGYVISKKTNEDRTWTDIRKNMPHLKFWCLRLK